MSAHAHAAHGHHRNYVRIWAILLVLLVISVVGPMLGNRVITLITAFGIAGVEAWLVAKNFMHLDVEKPIVKWALAITLAFMVMLYAGVAPDAQKQRGQNWKKTYVPKTAAPAQHGTEEHGAGSH